MAPDNRRELDMKLSLEARIDGLCDRFEAAWKAGLRPRIDDFLKDATEGHRRVLFGELLAVELEYRRRAGEEPTEADYS